MNALTSASSTPSFSSSSAPLQQRSTSPSSASSHFASSSTPRTAREAAPLRVAGYARVSTDLQRDKDTIATQKELIEQFCSSNGYLLTEIYADDGVSGTTHLQERPEASRLMVDAYARKFDALVVYKGDRIGRDVLVNEIAVRELFDKLGIAILGIAEQIDLATPIGRAMFTFQSAIGRLERENTLRRSKDATLRLAREGVWLGGIVPFGYRVEGKGRSARLRLADEPIEELGYSEVDVVRLMYHLSAEEGKSSIEIARLLNELGVPTVYTREGREVIANKRKAATRGEWTRGRVRNMMVETVYYGLHQWGKKTLRRARKKVALNTAQRHPTQRLPTLSTQHGSHAQHEAHRDSDGSLIIQRSVPAIVPFKVWQAAQVTMHRNAVARPDLTKRKYLLRGLMKCALCGSTYIGSTRTDSPRKGKRDAVEGESRSECNSGNRSDCENKHEKAKPNLEAGTEEVEIQDGQVLRPYYLCNGHQHIKSTGAKCPSAHLRALDIEAMLWNEVEGFLRHPEEVLGELAAKLKQTFEGAGALQVEEELKVMRQQKAAVDDGRASLFRLFRRGAMSEEDLDRQLGEMVEEENALGQKIERLEREVAKARDSNAMLHEARALLERLEQKLDASLVREPIHLPSPAPSWEVRRRIVEEIVLGVEIDCHIDPGGLRGQNFTSTLHVTYIFEPRDLAMLRAPQAANGSASGLTLQRVHTVTSRTQARKSDWQNWVQQVLQEEPTARLSDIIERVEQRQGVRLSRAAISRIRADLGLAPDNAQSRAAKSKFKGKVELSD